MKLLKLENKPLLIGFTLALIGLYFYFRQTNEGFSDSKMQYVGTRATLDLTRLGGLLGTSPDLKGSTGMNLIIESSTGNVLWDATKGSASQISGTKDVIIIASPAMANQAAKYAVPSLEIIKDQYPMLTLSDATAMDNKRKSEGGPSLDFKCNVFLKDGKYVDKNGTSVIGSSFILNYNIPTTQLYIGIFVLVFVIFLLIVMMLTRGKRTQTPVNRNVEAPAPSAPEPSAPRIKNANGNENGNGDPKGISVGGNGRKSYMNK